MNFFFFFFFFQAEDGIRDADVTGVQTCALPICHRFGHTVPSRAERVDPGTERSGAVEIGFVGLGKMGGNMAERLRRGGHTVYGFDRAPSAPRDVSSIEELVQKLAKPRVVWVMVPSGEPTRQTVAALGDILEPGDLVVDGGNSRYTDDQVHAERLGAKGIGYIDAGVSGGGWGLENGYALMVG